MPQASVTPMVPPVRRTESAGPGKSLFKALITSKSETAEGSPCPAAPCPGKGSSGKSDQQLQNGPQAWQSL